MLTIKDRLQCSGSDVAQSELARGAICESPTKADELVKPKSREEPDWIVSAMLDIAGFCQKSHRTDLEVILRRAVWEIEACLDPDQVRAGVDSAPG